MTMGLLNSFNFDGVFYSAEFDTIKQIIDLKIQNCKKSVKPESLYKYYSLSIFSVDAFVNHYLFSAHPHLINDKYDCSGELIDYSKQSLNFYINCLANELNVYSEDRVRQIFNSNDKWVLDSAIADLIQSILFMKFGIISMTEKPNDILMWAFYAQNSGFALEFNTSLLPKSFFGPFPINYCEYINKIDFSIYDPLVCFLYETNIKSEKWKYENEWRYLTIGKEDKYLPYATNANMNYRRFYYNPDAIEQVILGYDFFNPIEIEYCKRTPEYDIIKLSHKKLKMVQNLKRRILNLIIKNRIKCSQIVRSRNSFSLVMRELRIEKLTSNYYKIFNSFKHVY